MARRSQTRVTGSRSQGLEKKLARYAIAGSAVLAAPFAASAQYYSGIVNDPINLTTTPVNLDGTPVNFTAEFYSFEGDGWYQNIVASGTSVQFVPGTNSNPAPLTFGSLISTANATGTQGLLLSYGGNGFKSGNWPQNHTSAYVGFQFTTVGTYVGWADVSVNVDGTEGDPMGTLISYDYTPASSITAGEITSAPEPSSLALFALGGAAALELLRRRRAAQRN